MAYTETLVADVFDAQSVTTGASSTSSAVSVVNAIQAHLTVKCLFDSGASGDLTVEILTSPDNTLYDNIPFDSMTLASTDMDGSYIVTKSKALNVQGIRYLKVLVRNGDSASVTVDAHLVKATL